MNRGELLDFLTNRAKEFRKDTTAICRNKHLTAVNEQEMPRAIQIDGTLDEYINNIGMHKVNDYD